MLKIAVQDSAASFSEIKGVQDGFKLVWTQTSDLFKPPHLNSMVKLCLLMFCAIGVSQGLQMWYASSNLIFKKSSLCQFFKVSSNPYQLYGNNRHASHRM